MTVALISSLILAVPQAGGSLRGAAVPRDAALQAALPDDRTGRCPSVYDGGCDDGRGALGAATRDPGCQWRRGDDAADRGSARHRPGSLEVLGCSDAAPRRGDGCAQARGRCLTASGQQALPLAACPPNSRPVPRGCIPRSAVRVYAGERCKSARKAVSYYRDRTWSLQTARGGGLADRTPVVRNRTCRWARLAAATWIARAKSAKKALAKWRRDQARIPVGEAELRAYVNDDCLEEIIDRETAGTWSPTIYNYAGSGAYGLPQALPGHKMASAGPDWRTNPKTQIAWMRSYVNSRYGGSCAALAHHNAQGWY